jgi:TRAP-type C4-dicarboxylate transport system permease small subunit
MHAVLVLQKIYRAVDRVLLFLAHLALMSLMLLSASDALLRYSINYPLVGVSEASDEFLMPALVFFVAAHIYERGGLIRISTFSDFLPVIVQRAIMTIGDLAGLVFFAAVAYGVAKRAIDAYSFLEYSPSPLNYLIYPSYLIVAVGSAFMAIRIFVSVVTARHPAAASGDFEH